MTLLDSLNLFLEGIDLGLSTLSDLVSGEVFGLGLFSKLPLVGDALADAGGFMDDIRNDLIQPMQQVLGTAVALAPQILDDLRDAMEVALGSGPDRHLCRRGLEDLREPDLLPPTRCCSM